MSLPVLILAVLFANFGTILTWFIITTDGFALFVIILRWKIPFHNVSQFQTPTVII